MTNYSLDEFYLGDFLRISDRVEAVTLQRKGGTVETISGIRMPLRKSIRNGEKNVLNAGYLSWHLSKNNTISPPRPDDKIIDLNGNVWIIIHVQSSLDRWIITTHNDQCVGAFVDILVLEKPVFSKATSGDQTITWTSASPGIRAEISMLETKWSNTTDGVKMMRILLPRNLQIEQGMRLHSSDDRIFTIRSFRSSAHFPGILEVDAETDV